MKDLLFASYLCSAALLIAAEPALSERGLVRLKKEVRHELVMLPYYGVFDNLAYSITSNGKVTLLGHVTRPALKRSAENTVKDLEGVTSIANQIEVLPPSPNDDRLRLNLYQAIYSSSQLNRYALQAVPSIHIIVKNGQASLEGVAANQADKNVAAIYAKAVAGVFSVTNNLQVEEK